MVVTRIIRQPVELRASDSAIRSLRLRGYQAAVFKRRLSNAGIRRGDDHHLAAT